MNSYTKLFTYPIISLFLIPRGENNMNKFRCYINQGLLVAVSMFAMVSANADVVGTWEGQVTDGNRPVSVVLTVDQDSTPGQTAGKIDYGKPWDCSLIAQYSGSDQKNTNSRIFALSVPLIGATPGPHCKALIDGSIAATPGSNGSLNIVVSTKKNEVKDTTDLHRRP